MPYGMGMPPMDPGGMAPPEQEMGPQQPYGADVLSIGQGQQPQGPMASDFAGPYTGPGAQAMPLPQAGGNAAPIPSGLSGQAQMLLAKDYAQHGAVQLQELDRAAKFRRALSMIQETFATITGREDIAARVRAQIVDEDQKRAAAMESQILARVGRQALESERLQAEAEKQQYAQKSEAAKIEVDAKHRAGSIDDAARWDGAAFYPDGSQVPTAVLQEAAYQMRKGNAAPMAAFTIDKTKADIQKKLRENEALLPGEVKKAAATSAASAAASQSVRDRDENDPAKKAQKLKDMEAESAARARGSASVKPPPKEDDPKLATQALTTVEKNLTDGKPEAAVDELIGTLEDVQAGTVKVPPAHLAKMQRRLLSLEAELEGQLNAAMASKDNPDPQDSVIRPLKYALAAIKAAK